jgi:predicted RNA-binding protein with PIN domain
VSPLFFQSTGGLTPPARPGLGGAPRFPAQSVARRHTECACNCVLQWRRPTRGAAVTFLIDGYNLMHAVGLARRGLPAGELARARTRLLDWLADSAGGRATVRVVFDSGRAESPEAVRRGVRVLFARGRTADDEIEELLAAEPRPASVTVVSNDARVREAGRRRGAAFLTCQAFIDWTLELPRPEAAPPPGPEADKPDPTPAETAAWLAAFSAPLPKRRRR